MDGWNRASRSDDGRLLLFTSARFKTRHVYKTDMIVTPIEYKPLIDFYVGVVRPVFAAKYRAASVTDDVRSLESEKALFLESNGVRVQKYNFFTETISKLLNKTITMTTWRKIITTEVAETLPDYKEAIAQSNTHHERAAEQHYRLKNHAAVAIKAAEGVRILAGMCCVSATLALVTD